MSFSLSLTRLWPALRFSWLAFLVLFIGLRLLQDWIRRDLLLPEFAVYAHASVAATPAVPTIHATPLATGTAAGPDVGPVASPTGSPASPAKNAARPTPGGMMPQTKRLSRIRLWVQDLDQIYLYMMEAFYLTLMTGFTVACNRGAWQLDFQVVKNQAFPAAIEKVGFQKGDVFVWIGFHYAPEIDWQRLRHKGVYTIYVDTEQCPPKVDSDEIWLFHWMSFDRCPLPNRPMYRYVPTGFRPNRASAVHLDYRPKVNLFECVQCRVGCWGELRRQFGASLQTNSGVWVADDTTFANYIKTRSVFVTVPKVCAEGMYVPAARISDLLSSGVFIISLRSYPDDERMFRGLVNFTEFDKMGAVYQRIANMSGQERQRMAATIRSEYAKRFAPSVIFERANIYALLDRLRRGLPPPPDPQLQLRRQRQHQQQQQQQQQHVYVKQKPELSLPARREVTMRHRQPRATPPRSNSVARCRRYSHSSSTSRRRRSLPRKQQRRQGRVVYVRRDSSHDSRRRGRRSPISSNLSRSSSQSSSGRCDSKRRRRASMDGGHARRRAHAGRGRRTAESSCTEDPNRPTPRARNALFEQTSTQQVWTRKVLHEKVDDRARGA